MFPVSCFSKKTALFDIQKHTVERNPSSVPSVIRVFSKKYPYQSLRTHSGEKPHVSAIVIKDFLKRLIILATLEHKEERNRLSGPIVIRVFPITLLLLSPSRRSRRGYRCRRAFFRNKTGFRPITLI